MTSRGPRYPADTAGKPSSSDQPVGEQVNQIIATAWFPPAVADEAAVLRAEQEARRFLAEFTRLSNLADAQDADEELLEPIAEHRERLLDFIRSAPVTSAATAAAVLHFLIHEEVGLGAHMPDERDFAAFARVTAWAEAVAAGEKRECQP